MKLNRFVFFVLLLFIVGMTACVDDTFTSNPQYTVSFSTDTVSFDTVFTKLGSSTREIKIYNKNNYNLRLSEISLGGSSSNFYLNVDGRTRSDNRFTDLELRANDSMYIFVQVTVDPTNQNSPVLIEDSIKVMVNGVKKQLHLQAYGQDVIIFKNKTIYNDTLLTNTKPYLIYGNLVSDTMKTMTIEKGSTLYFHNKAKLKIKGNLIAKGTQQQPILFRGDRFDKMEEGTPYDDLPKQWDGIQLTWTKAEHDLEYIILRNGVNGIDLSNGKETEQPKLTLQNARIYNFSENGIVAKNAEITTVNSEIANCGIHCLYLLGGSYTFVHSTIANYYKESYRNTPSVVLKNYVSVDGNITNCPINKADFKNCIIYGANSNEVSLDNKVNNVDILAPFNYLFKNCLLKSAQQSDSRFESTVWSTTKDTVFVSTKKPYKFQLYKHSPAIDKGDAISASPYPLDMLGIGRLNDTAPDLGAYEWTTGN